MEKSSKVKKKYLGITPLRLHAQYEEFCRMPGFGSNSKDEMEDIDTNPFESCDNVNEKDVVISIQDASTFSDESLLHVFESTRTDQDDINAEGGLDSLGNEFDSINADVEDINDASDLDESLSNVLNSTNIDQEYIGETPCVNGSLVLDESLNSNAFNSTYNMQDDINDTPRFFQNVLDISNIICIPEETVNQNHNFRNKSSTCKMQTTITSSYECNICRKLYMSKKSLVRHKKTHHIDANENYCTLCNKTFSNIPVKLHKESVHNNDQYMCHICDKIYKTYGGLYTHIQCHNEKYRFICQHCGIQFQYKSMFDSHVATHTLNKKPYLCNKCGKGFSHVSNLSSHTKICGIKNKTFECNVCAKLFKTKRYLSVHSKTMHTSSEQYQCTKCGKKFRHRGSLTNHNESKCGLNI